MPLAKRSSAFKWTLLIGSMLGLAFCFYLEKVDDHKTKISNESFYKPANFMVGLMNTLMMKRKMGQIQQQILTNIKTLAENNLS